MDKRKTMTTIVSKEHQNRNSVKHADSGHGNLKKRFIYYGKDYVKCRMLSRKWNDETVCCRSPEFRPRKTQILPSVQPVGFTAFSLKIGHWEPRKHRKIYGFDLFIGDFFNCFCNYVFLMSKKMHLLIVRCRGLELDMDVPEFGSRVDRLLWRKQRIHGESFVDASSHATTTWVPFCLTLIIVTGPSQNRAGAIYAHGSSHSQFTENPNILTLIRGFGKGNRFSISLNFSQLRLFFFPLRFSHLNSSFFTSSPNRAIPRRLSVTP